MILNIKELRDVCKSISTAVDATAANLEIKTKDSKLYLAVTNKEYYACVSFNLSDATEDFRAVVDADLFLNLISGITAETIELCVNGNAVKVTANKSTYKLPIIFENDNIMELPVISIQNKTVEMPISNDVLQSILTVNSKELAKLKNMTDIKALNQLYYITNEGCFTFTNGATLNSFKLEKPVQMFLNDRIVKLFKLFKTDVLFSMGQDALPTGIVQTKVVFETENIYLAAITVVNDILLNQVQRPSEATKQLINEPYKNKLVLSVNQLAAALSRIMLFTKNSIAGTNMLYIPATITVTPTELKIIDKQGNVESVNIENGSFIESEYTMPINLADIKLVLDSCKDEHITLNCGNERSIVIAHGTINNLIPECTR